MNKKGRDVALENNGNAGKDSPQVRRVPWVWSATLQVLGGMGDNLLLNCDGVRQEVEERSNKNGMASGRRSHLEERGKGVKESQRSSIASQNA
ncbi:hypothetical protein RUM43_003601 [Polyplax serrata]|uniref:Uncharacterized protein n=1 Tax=Polyplax serrata TaxID=468196 RepID=A0AAN8RXB1_POLSC